MAPRSFALRAFRVVVVCGLIGLVTAFHGAIGLTNTTTVALSLLLVVLATAALWGLVESLVASVVATLCFNYFFLPPVGTWVIADPQNWVALFSFLVVSVVASQLSERARRKAREAIAHQQETARLAELARQAELVRKGEEFKSTLLDSLAHELKTPLTSLKAAVSALRANPAAPEAQRELLSIAEEETDRLNRLVSEILQMAGVDAGKLRLNRESTSVERLLERTLGDAARLLDGRELKKNVPAGLPTVSADLELVQTLLNHLLDNAAKYSAPGRAVQIRADRQDRYVRIQVADEGPGLDDAELSQVFERCYRGAATRDTVPGAGMGLAIARGIVAAHGGRIWAESQPGVGTCFSFTLPLDERSQG